MLRKTRHKMSGVKTVIQHVVEQQQRLRHIMRQGTIHQREIIVRIEHIQHLDRALVTDGRAAECHQLVKDRERITHTSVCFLRHYIQRLFAHGNTFFLRHGLQISHRVRHRDTIKIIYLATAQNSRQHLVFLRRSEDENCV